MSDSTDRFTKWFMGITSTGILLGVAYIGNRLGDIENRLTVIETRQGQDNTETVRLMVDNQIYKAIQQYVPPKAVTERMDRLESEIERLKRDNK